MEFNRNHYFLAGLVILLLGIQFRSVDSFVLNEKTTRFLAGRRDDTQVTSRIVNAMPIPRKVVRPPEWLGYSMLSIGSVLVLHSLAMKKPGG